VARLAHGFTSKSIEWSIERQDDIIHVTSKETDIGATYHVSMIYRYGTVNANLHFSETEKGGDSSSHKINVGEVHLTSRQVIGLYQIPDYLRSKSYLLPFGNYTIDQIKSLGWAKEVER